MTQELGAKYGVAPTLSLLTLLPRCCALRSLRFNNRASAEATQHLSHAAQRTPASMEVRPASARAFMSASCTSRPCFALVRTQTEGSKRTGGEAPATAQQVLEKPAPEGAKEGSTQPAAAQQEGLAAAAADKQQGNEQPNPQQPPQGQQGDGWELVDDVPAVALL